MGSRLCQVLINKIRQILLNFANWSYSGLSFRADFEEFCSFSRTLSQKMKSAYFLRKRLRFLRNRLCFKIYWLILEPEKGLVRHR